MHKAMMGMLKVMISKKDPEELSDDDKGVLDTYGKKVDFTDKNTINPLLLFLKE